MNLRRVSKKTLDTHSNLDDCQIFMCFSATDKSCRCKNRYYMYLKAFKTHGMPREMLSFNYLGHRILDSDIFSAFLVNTWHLQDKSWPCVPLRRDCLSSRGGRSVQTPPCCGNACNMLRRRVEYEAKGEKGGGCRGIVWAMLVPITAIKGRCKLCSRRYIAVSRETH